MAEKKNAPSASPRTHRTLRGMLKVSGYAADATTSLISTALRLVGTVLLILLISGILFIPAIVGVSAMLISEDNDALTV